MEINDDVYRDLLGICLTDSTKIPYITTKVSIDTFPKGVYKIIYQAIIDLYNLGVDVDIVTVSNRLLNTSKLKEIGGRVVINDLALNAIASRYTNQTIEAVLKQNTFKKVSGMVDEFNKDLSNSDDINKVCMDYCSKISNIISGNMESDKLETISDGVDEVIADMRTSKDYGTIGLDTGFPTLNFYTGGLQKGKIYVIGARPSQGKSSFAMNIAEYVAKNHNVLFISLEMSKKEYAQRMLFSRAGVDVNKINSGTVTDGDIAKVSEQKSYLDELNLFIETKTPCKVSDVELAIINLQSTKGSCDLVVVDYLQLLTPMGKNSKNREVEVAEMSRDLKSLAMKYQVPIIVLSQLSRSLESREDKRPILSDLRESGAIEQDADVVTFLYRNEYYFPDDPGSRGKGELLIRKNRGGQNNKDIEMCWQPSKVKFTEAIRKEDKW
jgi:replicative DNA helicase